jgi:hypothetical protein
MRAPRRAGRTVVPREPVLRAGLAGAPQPA